MGQHSNTLRVFLFVFLVVFVLSACTPDSTDYNYNFNPVVEVTLPSPSVQDIKITQTLNVGKTISKNASFSKQNNVIVSSDNYNFVFDKNSGKLLHTFSRGEFTPDGSHLFTYDQYPSTEYNANLINTETGKPSHKLGNSQLYFSPDGTLAGINNYPKFETRNLESWDLIQTVSFDNDTFYGGYTYALSNNSQYLATLRSEEIAGADCVIEVCMLYTLVLTSIQADKAIANTSWKDYRLNYSETLKFSPDSSFIALTSEEARLWQVNTASENPLSLITTLKSLNPIRDITFSQDSQYIHANGLLLNTQTGTPVFENSNFTATAISSDSSTLATTTKASGNSNVEISLWNKEKQLKKVITTDSKSAITSLTFSLNNNELLSSNTDGSIILWDIATGKAIQTFETHLESLSEQIVTLTSDGKALKIGSKETIKTIDIASNTLINEVKLKINPAVDPSINYWLKNSDYDLRAFQDDVSSKIYLVSTATGEMKEFKANIRSDEYITLSGIVDDKTIAIGAGSKTYIVDIDSSNVTKSFDYTYANFNAQGTKFIGQRYNSSSTESGYYAYHLIDVTTGKQLWEMKFNSNDSFPSDLGFTKDGSKIFYSEYQDNSKWLTLKDAANGKTLYRYKSDINLFHHQLSPDGSYIITKEIDSDQSSSFSTVGFLWSTKNGALLKKLPGLLDYGYSVAFSSDGTKLIVGSGHGNYNNTITIYSTPNNEPVFIEQSSN